MLGGVRTLVAALRRLYQPHRRHDCVYAARQLYVQLARLERSPYTDDGLFGVYRAVRCRSPPRRPAAAPAAAAASVCRRLIDWALAGSGFDSPYRNTGQLAGATCAYLRVLARFLRCCRNLFASVSGS